MEATLNQNDDYEKLNYYTLRLLNEDYRHWETTLSFLEAKALISSAGFINVGTPDEINTKTIAIIRDDTKRERNSRRRKNQDTRERYELTKLIREFKYIPLRLRWSYQFKHNPHDRYDWMDHQIGLKLDPLMKYNKKTLEFILSKLNKKHKTFMPSFGSNNDQK